MAADLSKLHSPTLHGPTIRTIASPYPPSPSNHLSNRPFHFPTFTPRQIPSLHHHSHKTPRPGAEDHSRPLQHLIPTAHLSSRSLENMDLALHSWCIRPLAGEDESAECAERRPGQHSGGACHDQPQHHC
ncbi:uncharacterized protein LOC131256493 [Magnolia sinica]|uniref:uncharacterized protein LOC131256493 n=1 Tax=Magnolia sinica TaxID=86752 RepID=UPI00265A7932|nr:uncharacterized protein LOC131256493 [Magnolia sinica]